MHISPFQNLIRVLKVEKVFDFAISCGKSASLFSRYAKVSTPRDVVRVFGSSNAFSFSYDC